MYGLVLTFVDAENEKNAVSAARHAAENHFSEVWTDESAAKILAEDNSTTKVACLLAEHWRQYRGTMVPPYILNAQTQRIEENPSIDCSWDWVNKITEEYEKYLRCPNKKGLTKYLVVLYVNR